MSLRRALPWLRMLGGATVLGLVVWWVGTGPFLQGVRVVNAPAALAALLLGATATVCNAWRWRRVSGALGVALSLPAAVAGYYRSQFLNATLPTGVVGDLHRAVRQGRSIGDVGLGARSVVLDRAASLVSQVTLAAVLLMFLPSPLHGMLAGVAALGGAVVLALGMARLGGRLGAIVVAASGTALSAHLVVFLIAARAAGSTAPLHSLVAPSLIAIFAGALPLSLFGLGPREGAAGWAFGAVGLGTAQGVTTSVAYGVLSLIAVLPGAVMLIVGWLPSGVSGVPAGQGGWK